MRLRSKSELMKTLRSLSRTSRLDHGLLQAVRARVLEEYSSRKKNFISGWQLGGALDLDLDSG
jgi:hypothetical protein